MVETRIREVRMSCIRCGNTFLEIKNALIPIHFKSVKLICANCSAVIKTKDDFQSESFEPENQLILKKDLYNPEKYT